MNSSANEGYDSELAYMKVLCSTRWRFDRPSNATFCAKLGGEAHVTTPALPQMFEQLAAGLLSAGGTWRSASGVEYYIISSGLKAGHRRQQPIETGTSSADLRLRVRRGPRTGASTFPKRVI